MLDLSIFASQFDESDSDDESVQIDAQDDEKSVEIESVEEKRKKESITKEEDSANEQVPNSRFKDEGMEKEIEQVDDIFSHRRIQEAPIVDEQEGNEIEPMLGRNIRKWDLKEEEDFGGAIYKAVTQHIHFKPKKSVEDLRRKGQIERGRNKGIRKVRGRYLRSYFQVTTDRLYHNHNNDAIIGDQGRRKRSKFSYWPRQYSENLENNNHHHWSSYCRMIAKITGQLVVQNGANHPQVLQFLSLMFKTPHDIAPHQRIGHLMIQQSIRGFGLRGHWNNKLNIVQILDVHNPTEGHAFFTAHKNRLWKQILQEKKDAIEAKRKKRKHDTLSIDGEDLEKQRDSSANETGFNVDEKEDDNTALSTQRNQSKNTKPEISKDDDSSDSSTKYKTESDSEKNSFHSDRRRSKDSSSDIKSDIKEDYNVEEKKGLKFAKDNSNVNDAFYEIDFSKNISDDENIEHDGFVAQKPKERELFLLDNVRRHIYKRGIVHYANLDVNTIRLTLSLLLSKLGEERVNALRKKNRSHAFEKIESIHKEIISFLEICFKKVDTLPIFILSSPKAIVAQLFFSYYCNAGFGITSDTYLNLDDGNEVSTVALAETMKNASEDFRSAKLIHNFPAVNATLGICEIAASIGKTGARIIAQDLSWYGTKRRTPFDLMKEALEYLEDHKILKRWGYDDEESVDSTSDEEGKIEEEVDAAGLLDSFEKASQCFSICINAEPDNILYNSWYLASLAGGMIVSSGMSIGKKNKETLMDYKVEETRLDEKRFLDYRKFAVIAFQNIQKIAIDAMKKSLESVVSIAQIHLAISSFLEWSDAICLMIDGFAKNTKSLKEIRKTHAWHSIQWALDERNTIALERMRELCESKEVISEVVFALQANLLESNFSKKQAWIDMYSVLGTVGKNAKVDDHINRLKCGEDILSEREKDAVSTNLKSKFLLNGAHIDHVALDNRSLKGWWGDGRSWWESFVFLPLPSSERFLNPDQKMTPSELYSKMNHLSKLLELDFLDMNLNLDGQQSHFGIGLKSMSEENADNDFLYDVDAEDDDSFSAASDEQSVDIMDDVPYLPKQDLGNSYSHFTHGIFPKHINDLSLSPKRKFSHLKGPKVTESRKGDFFEFLVFKIAVACHLLGTDHPYITSSIVWIAEICSSFANDCDDKSIRYEDSYNCLLWLVSIGLDVMKILQMNQNLLREK